MPPSDDKTRPMPLPGTASSLPPLRSLRPQSPPLPYSKTEPVPLPPPTDPLLGMAGPTTGTNPMMRSFRPPPKPAHKHGENQRHQRRRRRKWPWILLAIVVAFLLLFLLAPTPPAPAGRALPASTVSCIPTPPSHPTR